MGLLALLFSVVTAVSSHAQTIEEPAAVEYIEPASRLPDLLKCLEGKPGCRVATTAYYSGAWTIGWGHAHRVHPGQVIDLARAEALLAADIDAARQCVDDAVDVPMWDHQRDALASFAFNTGCGGFKRSGLARAMNSGLLTQVPTIMRSWVKSGGVRMAGLVKRRAIEVAYFEAGPQAAVTEFQKRFPGGWTLPS